MPVSEESNRRVRRRQATVRPTASSVDLFIDQVVDRLSIVMASLPDASPPPPPPEPAHSKGAEFALKLFLGALAVGGTIAGTTLFVGGKADFKDVKETNAKVQYLETSTAVQAEQIHQIASDVGTIKADVVSFSVEQKEQRQILLRMAPAEPEPVRGRNR